MPSKYGSAAPQPPANATEAKQWLTGWPGPEKAAAALREIQPNGKSFAESFYQFRITGAAPNSGAGKTVRGWELYEKVTGQEPDTTPQPTGNCVAAAADDIVELTQCVQILVNGGTFKPIYNPFHYATGRVLVGKNQLRGGAGSYGSWQAKALELYGAIPLTAGLPKYNQQNVDAWGDDKSAEGKNFRDFLEAAKENVVQTTSLVSAWEQQRDALYAGHFSTIASNRGYSMFPDAEGFHVPKGAWGHQMSVQGYGENPKYPQWVALKNQWGDVHKTIRDFETGKPWPKGFLRVRLADYINKHLRMAGAECITYSGFRGYPALDLWSKGWA